MKAIDLLKVLSDNPKEFGTFEVVEGSFLLKNYSDWLYYVLAGYRAGLYQQSDVEGEPVTTVRGKGYDKIRKYIEKHVNKSLLVYEHITFYTRDNENLCYRVEYPNNRFKNLSSNDVLLRVGYYQAKKQDNGDYYTRELVIELLK